MKQNKKKYLILALAVLPLFNACSDSWLEPKPLSFYSPENTYVDASGLYSALVACERNMRHEYFGDGAPILTEMYTTDIAVHGKTDESGSLVDLDNEMLPARTKNDMKGKNKWYWDEGFKGIKYANIVISRLDAATYKDEAEKNGVLGGAYFHRTYRYYTMRNGLPYWAKGAAIKTPEGKTGTAIVPDNADKRTEIDNDYLYGRGIGTCRPTNYYQYAIWTDKEKSDLRGPFNHDSWTRMEDLRYNEPSLKKKDDPRYGQPLVRPGDLTVADSIRCWYMWPHYKLFVPDPTKTQDLSGGETPWYIYRSAEVYLMMAECYYWKGDGVNTTAMLNVVRQRAGAEPLNGSVGMAEVLAERARELYYEENRHIELVRISYLYAKTGKSCEALGGLTYKLDNISGPGGTGTNCKDPGVNFYFDWVMAHNNFYNKGVKIPNGEYRMSVHHILWPIPENAIKTNTGGVINQNIGYPGAENNLEPLNVSAETETELI